MSKEEINLIKNALQEAEMRQGCTDQTPYAEILLKQLNELSQPQEGEGLLSDEAESYLLQIINAIRADQMSGKGYTNEKAVSDIRKVCQQEKDDAVRNERGRIKKFMLNEGIEFWLTGHRKLPMTGGDALKHITIDQFFMALKEGE